VGPDLTLFTDAGPATALVAECWRLVDGGASVDDVLGAIVHEGLRAVGAFVLASPDRVLVRGAVTVELVGPDGTRQPLDPVTTPTWHEPTIDAGVAALVLSTADLPADRPQLPLSHGVALASEVTVVRDPEATTAPPVRTAPEPAVPAPSDPAPDPAPRGPAPASTAPQQVRVTEQSRTNSQYDDLFAMSRVPDVSPAPVSREPAPVVEAPVPREIPLPAPPPAPVEPSYAPPPATGFMGHLPWAPEGRGTPWAATPVPARQSDLGVTLHRPRRTPAGGVRVSAVRCPDGHLNPAAASVCRVCRAAVADQEPFETARPRLGVLLLSTDPEPVALDRSVVLGRAPSASGDADRIALHRPDISGNHLEVRLSGWQVLAVDLGSTNGTVVTTSDGRTTDLSPHVPLELHHGADVALSEEIRFRFEVT
jgi:hypothetical protein